MQYIWKMMSRKNRSKEWTYRAVLWTCCCIAGIAGLLVWLIVRNWAFQGLGALFCFIGYPVVLTWGAVVLYFYRHEFPEES